MDKQREKLNVSAAITKFGEVGTYSEGVERTSNRNLHNTPKLHVLPRSDVGKPHIKKNREGGRVSAPPRHRI